MLALRTPEAASLEEPAEEMWERLLACPALGVKYMEVSCKTNRQIHSLERVIVRALLRLQSADSEGGSVAHAPGQPHQDAQRGAGNLIQQVTSQVISPSSPHASPHASPHPASDLAGDGKPLGKVPDAQQEHVGLHSP